MGCELSRAAHLVEVVRFLELADVVTHVLELLASAAQPRGTSRT